jgi:hypothetical protein
VSDIVVKLTQPGGASFDFSPDGRRLLVRFKAECGSIVLDLERSAAFDLAEKMTARTWQLEDRPLPKQRAGSARRPGDQPSFADWRKGNE